MRDKLLGIREGFLPARQRNPVSARSARCLLYLNRSVPWVFWTQSENKTSEKVQQQYICFFFRSRNTNTKATEGHGRDAHDTLNSNPFVSRKTNLERTALSVLCFSLPAHGCTKQSVTLLQDKICTNLAKMKICLSWPIFSGAAHSVQPRKWGDAALSQIR